jgi:excisionase family DNA binding protein
MEETPRMITSAELAEYLRVSESTVWRKVAPKTREWPCSRVGGQIRFTQDQVARILEIIRFPERQPVRRLAA